MKENVKNNEQKKYRIFVVEDSDAYRTMVVEFLTRIKNSVTREGLAFSVRGFSSGEACLDHLHEKPDIIILDYFLNSGGYGLSQTGLDTLKAIKKVSPKTEVVILSCQNDIEVMKQLMKSGAMEYICKDNAAPLKIYDFISKAIHNKEKTNKFLRLFRISAATLLFGSVAVEFIIYFSG